MQNELLADCVQDMVDYVLDMLRLPLKSNLSNNIEILKDLEQMPENIKHGCNQRLSGFLLQEGVEDFSPFKGGKQRLLKALKALCLDFFESLNIKWIGYVVIGRQYSYDHIARVLSIPVDATFSVDQYFGLFHEIGHVIIRNKEYFKASPLPEHLIELFDHKGGLSREIFCDLFDYQCGFLGYYSLYEKTVPHYLAELMKKKDITIDIVEKYVLRFLCVTIYQNNYMQNHASKTKLVNLTKKILNKFLKESGAEQQFENEKEDLVSRLVYSANEMNDVLLVFNKLYTQKLSVFCQKRIETFSSNKFKAQFKQIMNGQIVHDLDHPQLVVLAMLKKKQTQEIPFKAHVAAIQSFLNCYNTNNWDGTYFPYKRFVAKQSE